MRGRKKVKFQDNLVETVGKIGELEDLERKGTIEGRNAPETHINPLKWCCKYPQTPLKPSETFSEPSQTPSRKTCSREPNSLIYSTDLINDNVLARSNGEKGMWVNKGILIEMEQ